MAASVIITVTKGKTSRNTFEYSGKEALVLGRLSDCAIVFNNSTVSRYHCIIDIASESVMVRDFGSLNGTYLNGKIIGQRPEGMSAEEGRKLRSNEFSLKNGDRLGLGPNGELTIKIVLPLYCTYCGKEIENHAAHDKDGHPFHESCIGKKNIKPAKGGTKLADDTCRICNKPLRREMGESEICRSCMSDPDEALKKLYNLAKNEGINDYRIVGKLGEGGMGEVWKVQLPNGSIKALKIMLPKLQVSESAKNLFMREALLHCQLKHPNIVIQDNCGIWEGAYYILMEYCNQGSVWDLMRKSGSHLSLETATDIILQVLDGLEYAHHAPLQVKLADGNIKTANGLVHRDFKPQNILLVESGRRFTAKIADFGLAKAFETSGLTGNTYTGASSGTPPFMPRQQAIDYKYAKPEVDVWAAAATYYFMLTGTFPRNFNTGEDDFKVILTSSAIPILKRGVSIPKKLAYVIDKALEDEPVIGIKSAGEFKRMIQEALR